jgi:AcrR family transcriptional regulator
MTGTQRREQLLDVGRRLFAERGLDGTSVEEIALRAGVSKPVVYEHFGGKEGLYAVVVDREVQRLLTSFTSALTADSPRRLLEQATLALPHYVEDESDGFRILVRRVAAQLADSGGFATIISDVAGRGRAHPGRRVRRPRVPDDRWPPSTARRWSGRCAGGQWWLRPREPGRDEVAAHLGEPGGTACPRSRPRPVLRNALPREIRRAHLR